MLTGCSSLSYLNCMDNNISYLDVSDCLKLKDLSCTANNLSYLDLSNNVLLESPHTI